MSPKLLRCIETWKMVLPDYEIKEWNESNFDFSNNIYAKQAYERKKWAFVSDYARLAILHKHGGIYLDTDVEVFKSFDPFLHHPAFVGFESDYKIGSAVIGSAANNPWISLMLLHYSKRRLVKYGFLLDMTPNTDHFTNTSKMMYGFKTDNTLQDLGDIVIYPKDYFYAKNNSIGEYTKNDNTVSIHHFDASWVGIRHKIKHKGFNFLYKILGASIANKALGFYKRFYTTK